MGRRSGGAIFGKKKPREGLDYTERQLDILCDNIPLTLASLTELRNIIKKATERGDTANRETATPHGSVPKTNVTTGCSEPSCPRVPPLNPSLQSTSCLLLMN